MSDSLGRHINKCDYCCGKCKCPQCKGKGYIVEDLDRQIKGMRKGDILLISYRFDPIGWLIRRFTYCQYNHAAWALNDHELIELKAIGRKITPLKKYMNKLFYKCKLVRITDIEKQDLIKALERAKQAKFNYSYSSSIINFLLIKLNLAERTPRLSCSGFIAYYLFQVDFYFNGKGVYYITPRDIEISKKVKDVTNELY